MGRKRKLDWGKIIELHNKGYQAATIARGMGCAVSQVNRIIAAWYRGEFKWPT